MSTSTNMAAGFRTEDTNETINAPALPADDGAGDGYDWMETLENTAWSILPNWGKDGWDAGAWPLIIVAVTRSRDRPWGPSVQPLALSV